MDATRSARIDSGDQDYDFDRLERSLDFLLGEHRRLSAEREELLGELREREVRIAALESKLQAERALRTTAVSSVDGILLEIERLRAMACPAAEGA